LSRWKVTADVASSNGAKQSVSNCMEKNVAIGMAGKALAVGKLNAANL
jgi:hypothetical protein